MPRRRWVGLVAVALVGALVTGGVAAAATGNVQGQVRDVARSIVGADAMDGAEPATPTEPAPQPTPAASGPAAAGVTAGPRVRYLPARPPLVPRGAGPVAEPDKEGLCKAFLASQDKGPREADGCDRSGCCRR
jgi:hypothetical protein